MPYKNHIFYPVPPTVGNQALLAFFLFAMQIPVLQLYRRNPGFGTYPMPAVILGALLWVVVESLLPMYLTPQRCYIYTSILKSASYVPHIAKMLPKCNSHLKSAP